jgi:hypothetical protein
MKPLRLFIILGFFLPVPNFSLAQHPKQEVIWYGYFMTLPLSENWYNVTEIQNRQLILPFQQSQFLIRTRFHRTWSNKWDTSVGFSTFLHHRERPLINDDFNWPEGRPHADATYKSKLGILGMEHRIRGEARFYQRLNPINELEEGFFFRGFRYRYRFQMTIPLAKSFQLKLANELMAMSGGTTGGLTFDQNRVNSDLVYSLSPQLQLELGYIHLFQQTGSSRFLRQDIFRVNLRHQLKKRK